ncbi:hypothetical protein K523DRAFT_368934 [Schizophyllum commune Tattone D]|nr:hypothetical protein K523DRAFT_368934 [Schizophyllum commune Tattone D]
MPTLENFDSAQVPHRPQRHPGVPPPMLSDGFDSACMCRRWQPREEAACPRFGLISMVFVCSAGVLIVAIVLLAKQAAATGRTVTYGLPCPFVANNAIHAIVFFPFLG